MNFIANLASSLLDEQEKFTDLTQVSVVDADACLDVLKKRFDNQKIYTHCGPLLVAVNPYSDIEGLYSDEVLEQHLALMPADGTEPHVYGMAARAYQKMMASGNNQAVVISGESGAGKTETAKFLLQYLAAAASGTSHNSEDGRGSLQRAVMGSNPIMESFGCAKTVRNDNSSRFGKLIVLRFTKTGRLQAASMQTYLLEKSRVIHQSAKECNFHAFFEMVHGTAPQDYGAIGLPQPAKSGPHALIQQFAYLNTDGGKLRDVERDAHNFMRTAEAMDAVGLDATEQTGALRLLTALLHLGNVSFGKGDDAKIDNAGGKALSEAAKLLACEPEHLADGMTVRKLKAGAEWVTTANSVEQATEVRHALVKQLYSYLFIWLVKRINQSLAQSPVEIEAGSYGGGPGAPSAASAAGPHIAYVDIFGFEIFERNSLEQLCINFANEKLQRLFVGVLFEAVQQMYVAEGVPVEAVEYDDNKKVVDLIGASPQGLLAMLTEECVFPKGSDTTYLGKINTAFKKNVAFGEQKTSPTTFAVHHFAGEVTYDVTGFLEKNKDPISQDLQVLVEFSDDPFVATMMKVAADHVREEAANAAAAPAEQAGGAGAAARRGRGGPAPSKMRSGKFVGVVDGFKASLRSLIATLQDGELHFIRCLKPNDGKEAQSWDRDVSKRQLQSAGLVQAVSASREGYADHLPPAHVVGSFGPLVPDLDLEQLDPHDLDIAARVLEECGVKPEQYAVGKTKIFLRPGVRGELERQRLEHIAERATLVQAMVRGVLARLLLRRLRESARKKAEEKRLREEAIRRQREEAERRRQEAIRKEAEARAKAEAEEAERRKKVQSARSLSFDRKRRKRLEEEERKKREEEMEREARKRAAEAKREEAQARMRDRLALEGMNLEAALERDVGASVDVTDGGGDGGEEDAVRRTEMAVARAEAAANAAASTTLGSLELPDSPSPAKAGGGPLGGGGFKLNLPTPGKASPAGLGAAVKAAPAPARLVEQRRMDEIASTFTCPLEDVIAFAEMIGMDPQEDLDLLWIADEALQAPEPVGWEQRLDPRGNTYYCNTITNMTMVQHPVDYHYQQLYLQMKMQRQQQQQYALMSPRSREQFDRTGGAAGLGLGDAARNGSPGGFRLDLRSISADSDDGSGPAQATPRGWLSRAKSVLTPRGSSSSEPRDSGIQNYVCQELEARVFRGNERLGMELNAYNQILSFQPGGPTDRHPDVKKHDRILGVDGIMLGSKMLTDVLQNAPEHTFIIERWAPPRGQVPPRPASPRTLLSLGKARANGASLEEAVEQAERDFQSRHMQSRSARRKAEKEAAANGGAPTCSRFNVTLVRHEPGGGLGIVADEDNVVVDMVPGSPADLQRTRESKGDPRLQLGDKIITVDGITLTPELPLSEAIQPQESHVLSVERIKAADPPGKAPSASSPMSPRGLLKAITPRGSKDKERQGANGSSPSPAAPSRALREVRLYKATEDERLGIRFVRDDDGFDRAMWGREDAVTPIVAALDPKGEAARAGIEIDDMVLSINGQTGLSNTEAAAQLRDLSGTIVLVVRRTAWLGQMNGGGGMGGSAQEEVSTPTPETPRSAMRRLI